MELIKIGGYIIVKQAKDLTFSIVAYKNYDQIINAVNTINKFTTSFSKEIIIVDNTEKNIRRNYSNEINKIKTLKNVHFIVNNCNLGFGKANNIALQNANGTFFVICNPDILLIENSFNKIIPYMREHPSVGAIIPKLIDKNHKIEPIYRRELTVFDVFIRYFHPFNIFSKRRAYHIMQDKDYSKPFRVPFGQGSFLVVRTKLMKQLKGFDERYFMYVEDADLCKRINQVSILQYFPYTSVIHLWKRGSHQNLKLMKWHIEAMIKYFRKWRN
ncbi:MAG TPA: glycosyltransferase family 2 protein [Candidatus Dwaynia gallinarum]|nr:glycosyltransferase family 2 protein [Candidatus Dwaynia gallinarum]